MLKIYNFVPLAVAALVAQNAAAQTVTPPPATPAPAGPAATAPMETVPALAPNVIAASPAADAPTPAPMPAPVCELHIWPAARVGAVTMGLGSSFGLLGVLIDSSAHANQNKRDQAFITAALDAKAQAKVLKDLDLPNLLHLPPSSLIMHDQGIDLKTDDTKRLSDSTSPCYYEFVVRTLSYIKTAAYAPQMRTFLSIRGFDGATIKTDFRDSKHGNLDVKLPKEGEDTGPATDALIGAFRFDVTFFANKFAKKKA